MAKNIKDQYGVEIPVNMSNVLKNMKDIDDNQKFYKEIAGMAVVELAKPCNLISHEKIEGWGKKLTKRFNSNKNSKTKEGEFGEYLISLSVNLKKYKSETKLAQKKHESKGRD